MTNNAEHVDPGEFTYWLSGGETKNRVDAVQFRVQDSTQTHDCILRTRRTWPEDTLWDLCFWKWRQHWLLIRIWISFLAKQSTFCNANAYKKQQCSSQKDILPRMQHLRPRSLLQCQCVTQTSRVRCAPLNETVSVSEAPCGDRAGSGRGKKI